MDRNLEVFSSNFHSYSNPHRRFISPYLQSHRSVPFHHQKAPVIREKKATFYSVPELPYFQHPSVIPKSLLQGDIEPST